jgi:hypothetical protein
VRLMSRMGMGGIIARGGDFASIAAADCDWPQTGRFDRLSDRVLRGRPR